MADAVADYLVETGLPVSPGDRVAAAAGARDRRPDRRVPSGLHVDTEPRIIEAGNVYEGEPLQSGVKDFIHPRNWWRLRNPWRPSWGEPFKEQADRMWAAIRDAAAATPDARHGDGEPPAAHLGGAHCRSRAARFLHDPRKRECALASVTSFRFEGGEPVAMTYATPAAHIKVPK